MGLFSRFKKKKEDDVVLMHPEPPQMSRRETLDAMLPKDDLQLAMLILQLESDSRVVDGIERDILPRVQSEDALYLLAMQAKERDIRIGSAKKIQNPDRLTQVALELPNSYGARTIMEKLQKEPDGMERLERISKEAKDLDVRKAAMRQRAGNDKSPEMQLEYVRIARLRDPLYGIEDTEFLEKHMVEDEDKFIRDSIARTRMPKYGSPALLQYVLREDNSLETRAQAATILLERGWKDPEGKLDEVLPKLIKQDVDLAFAMGEAGDNRAVPELARISRSLTFSSTGPLYLGCINTLDSVQALMDLLQTNQDARNSAAASLKKIYKNTTDPDVKNAIKAIPQKKYFDHIDAGEHGASCHTDMEMVDFYLDEE